MQAPALRRIPGEAGSYSLVLGLAVGIGVILLGAMAGAGLPMAVEVKERLCKVLKKIVAPL
jgi:hypothetical protein